MTTTTCPQQFHAQALPHRDVLYAAALRLTRDPNNAEDLVQETLLRAYGAWDRFLPGSNCRAWLMRILTNSFINSYRKRRRHRRFATERPTDALSALYGDRDEHTHNPQSRLLGATLGDEVRGALDSLTKEYREVIELADLQGVRYREIAKTLNVPIGTVMSRLFRARRLLEERLGEFAASSYGIQRAA